MFRLATDNNDVEILRQIFRLSIQKLAPSLYSHEQVIAWSDFANNIIKFQDYILGADTYVLENSQQIIGFCGFHYDGHIASFYVHPDFTRQGYGTKLLNYVLDKAIQKGIKRFYAEASFFSQPVFSRCGFDIVEIETVKYGEVPFDRYKMEKVIRN
ncbi:GNAT family N-acetyltransferase [Geminocystis sp. CENA526]|uniref:GNAT family N-acetyltransferase n=1 Tax=Geminocystis sp. CENA526 TaxID=1355871 RepID=UPI003D6E0D83